MPVIEWDTSKWQKHIAEENTLQNFIMHEMCFSRIPAHLKMTLFTIEPPTFDEIVDDIFESLYMDETG